MSSDRRVDYLKNLAIDAFPRDELIEESHHTLFKGAVLGSFHLTPRVFAAAPQIPDDIHGTNVARHVAEQILEAARQFFPVGAKATRANAMQLSARINSMFSLGRGQG